MALVVKDRVKETTATTGTGTLTLAGAVAGFQTFTSVLSNGDTTYYGIFESSTGEFEVGLGTFTSSGTTLARTTILESSNSGSAINLTAGAADVFITQPAEKAVYLDGSGYIATADGRNLTNVDADTVDSLHASSFIRSDANDTSSGTIAFGTGTLDPDSYTSYSGGFGTIADGSGWSARGVFLHGGATGQAAALAISGNTTYFGSQNGTAANTMATILSVPHSTNVVNFSQTPTVGTNVIWNAGNDGSGSGLDADTLDGVQGSSYLRSDANDTATGELTFNSKLDIANGVYLGWGGGSGRPSITGNKSSNLIQFYTGGAERLHIDNSGIDVTGTITADSLTVDDITINGSTISDGADLTVDVGGNIVLDADGGGIYFKDAGTTIGILQSDSGDFKISSSVSDKDIKFTGNDGGSTITALTLDMSDAGAATFNNKALIKHNNNNYDDGLTLRSTLDWGYGASLSFDAVTSSGGSNGTVGKIQSRWQSQGNHALDFYAFVSNSLVQKARLDADGLDVTGSVTADNIYLASSLIHEGDTDTKLEFGTNYINLITGNSTSATLNSSGIFVNDGSLAEDYDALSGTTPTCNVDNGGMFSLTMTGNTTFTFSGASSGYIQGFVLQLTGNGSTVTYPTSVDWSGGTAPDAPASGETDILVFITRDGGTTWYGALAIDAAAQGQLMSFGFTSFAQTTYGDSGVVDVSPPITGLVGASGVGSVTVTGEANFSVTGVAGTGGVGTATATPIIVVDVTGVVAQGFVGSMSTGGNAFVQPTGVAGTGGVGQISLVGNVIVSVTGVSGTGEVGDATAAAGAIVPPTGLEATGGVGSVTVTPRIVVNPTGVAGTGGIGTPVVTGDANVPPTGLEATGEVGSVTISADANVSPTGLSGTGQVGSVVATGGAIATVTGVSATGGVGSVTVTGKAVVSPTGVSATGEVTSVIVWGRIIPDPGNTWTEETPNPNTTWTDIAA